ncbi:Crp/Fnr family transcriptional regulator [Flavicella sediminum]|uniref:Crp/Fnr family transcriptional regulator n=1 Tax=Flavicella sediminum TaxID=2585141 RepID=UPI001121BBEA|nr:Crp/Fnr family transcriptional regulator [Flavicella sediminum]
MSDCITCENTNCLIKKNIKNPNIEKFLLEKHNIKCKKSQQFIMEGAPAHGLFFVRKGQVKVVKTGIYGREQIVRFAHDGEIIGHRGFGSGKNYPIGALAISETHLCNFTNEILTKMLHEIPNLTFDLMLFYSEELNRSETKVRKFAQMTVREKVIDSFLYIKRKFGQDADGFFKIQLPRKDFADFAGTTEEQVIRIISSLKKEKLLRSKGKKLGIIDIDLLKKEISEHNYFLDS